MTIDESKLNALLGKVVTELGAALVGTNVIIGDQLGLYKTLATGGQLTSHQLAERTGTAERYIREWLAGQAASGYIDYDATSDAFHLTPEQALVFANADSPALMTGGYYLVASVYSDIPRIADNFRTGKGLAWGEHCNCLFCGTERFFGPGYRANLVSHWLPSLNGVVDKLAAGGKVADVGCGHGISTIVMAQAFPNSHFFGFDYHPSSIERARELAKTSALANVTFDVATAKGYPGANYDLVTFFDCLHDMGDPVGAAPPSGRKAHERGGGRRAGHGGRGRCGPDGDRHLLQLALRPGSPACLARGARRSDRGDPRRAHRMARPGHDVRFFCRPPLDGAHGYRQRVAGRGTLA
jgi:2-polyprenyl-3-methyl-5-hydroxy-6-metoxy-1,4-benzoquinol methylase